MVLVIMVKRRLPQDKEFRHEVHSLEGVALSLVQILEIKESAERQSNNKTTCHMEKYRLVLWS